jgi:hypothetical protein
MADSVQRLMSAYERGLFTRMEVVMRLIQLAAELSAEEIASALPGDWLGEIRQKCIQGPQSSQEPWFWINSVCFGPDHDPDVHVRDEQARWNIGLSAWQTYINGSSSKIP